MKLTIKTLQQITFKIDIEPDKTVKDLKHKIEKEQGKDFPIGAQKLIYSGKILADDTRISDYEIDEKKFLVLMITRPPIVPKPVVSEKQPSVAQPKEEANTDVKPKPTTRSSSSAAAAAIATTASTASVAPVTTTAAATTAPSVPRTTSSTPTTATSISTPNTTTTTTTSLNQRLASLVNQPHFRQIQDLIQQSPHLLSSTIEALAGTDPEMYNFISENPDIFVTALNHPPTLSRGGQSRQQSAAAVRPDRIDSDSRQQPVVDHLLGVSEHDKEAIERLKELGFSEYLAIQAYMACDKDEQLAANLLFQMEQ